MCVIKSGYAPVPVQAKPSAYFLPDQPINYCYIPVNISEVLTVCQQLALTVFRYPNLNETTNGQNKESMQSSKSNPLQYMVEQVPIWWDKLTVHFQWRVISNL